MDLSHLVREVLDGPRVLPEAEEVRVEADLGGELLLLSDPLLLATALDNLVRNATDAADRSRSAGRGDHRHHSEICAGAAHLHHHAAGLEAGATHSQTLHPQQPLQQLLHPDPRHRPPLPPSCPSRPCPYRGGALCKAVASDGSEGSGPQRITSAVPRHGPPSAEENPRVLQKNLNLETRFPVDLRIGRKLPHLRMLMSAHILALEPVLANVLGGLAEAQRQRFRTEYLAALGTPGCVLFYNKFIVTGRKLSRQGL